MSETERWNWSDVTMIMGDQRITLRVLFYECFIKHSNRSWYRIYDHGVTSGSPRDSVIGQCVGYGDTFEEALEGLIAKRHGKL